MFPEFVAAVTRCLSIILWSSSKGPSFIWLRYKPMISYDGSILSWLLFTQFRSTPRRFLVATVRFFPGEPTGDAKEGWLWAYGNRTISFYGGKGMWSCITLTLFMSSIKDGEWFVCRVGCYFFIEYPTECVVKDDCERYLCMPLSLAVAT